MAFQLRRSYAFAKEHGVLPGDESDEAVELYIRPGADVHFISEIRRHVGKRLRPVWLSKEDFAQRLASLSHSDNQTAADVVEDIGQDMDLAKLVQDLPEVEDLMDADHDAPIIRMINALLTQAVRDGASDVHIEPFEQASIVRFRKDGILQDVVSPNSALHAAMVSRVKIMGDLDIAEKRLPQDGRISIRVAGKPVDIRVSTLPTNHGERVVMRLLDKSAGRLDLQALGMAADTLDRVDALIRQPHGIFLVTGPTGSGKTTTLYSILSRLDAKSQNIMTVEDPVEYDLHGIGQIQVNAKINLHFSTALRAILRQDPDVVMIGEIRDLETAQIAVQASLTGHLVLATLHTNDSASAVTRLIDMGVESFLLASSLLGVLAQRLLRRLCPACKQEYPITDNERLLIDPYECQTLYRAVGCKVCNHTGYSGRCGIYEYLEIDDAAKMLIHNRVSDQQLREHAYRNNGLRLLRDDGCRWVAAGESSLDELLRVTRD